jgi:DNA helicase-2/ATP-dependent DNA helicase PcrA
MGLTVGLEDTDLKTPKFETHLQTILAGLNPYQQLAVRHQRGPSLVLAGAGSGKTRVLTCKIAHLLAHDAMPGEVFAVTFTNKAAKEMRTRIGQLTGDADAVAGYQFWIGTFHSLCSRMLRRDIAHYRSGNGHRWEQNFLINDMDETQAMVKAAIEELNLDPKVYVPKNVRHQISTLKNRLLDAYDAATQARKYQEEQIAKVYAVYEAQMSRQNALDFDDLLMMPIRLFRAQPDILAPYQRQFRHVLVDEFQDTNDAQYELVRMLGDAGQWDTRSLTVVGDVDQSIYSWRGANFRILLNFQRDFPQAELIKLEENYRSKDAILLVANAIIQNNSDRLPKMLKATRGQGEPVEVFEAADDRDEALAILLRFEQWRRDGDKRPKDCCVLYRTTAQSRSIEDVLLARGIPYVLIGGLKFYERKEIKDALAYLRLLLNTRDDNSVLRVINVPRRGIGKTTLDRLATWTRERNQSLFETLGQVEEIEGISPKTRRDILAFVSVIAGLQPLAATLPVDDLLLRVLDSTGYVAHLKAEDPDDNDGRLANVEELVSVARQFRADLVDPEFSQGQLADFLTQISLLGDADTDVPDENKIRLMTIHAAKGLEFSLVAVCGMEEGLFPHYLCKDKPEQLEEERRLMYVAVTRAEDRLLLTYCRKRMLYGEMQYNRPSRFLSEAPAELFTGHAPPVPGRSYASTVARAASGVRHVTGEAVPPRRENPKSAASYNKISAGGASRQAGGEKRSSSGAAASVPGVSKGMPTAASQTPLFKKGDRVRHPKFGEGAIVQVLGQGEHLRYNIQFDAMEAKKLMNPAIARLEPLT